MKHTAQEIIATLPDDFETMHYVDDNNFMVTITRDSLIEGLQACEEAEDPQPMIARIIASISSANEQMKAGKLIKQDLANDLCLAFCYELLSGEISFTEASKVN